MRALRDAVRGEPLPRLPTGAVVSSSFTEHARRPDGSSAQVWQDRDGVWVLGVWDFNYGRPVMSARVSFPDCAAALRALQAWREDGQR